MTTLDSKIQSTGQGIVIDIFKKVIPETIQHAWEIQKDRLEDVSLRSMWFWTADFPLYTMEKGEAILYFADRKHNLAFQNMDVAVEQLRTKNNYFPKDTDISSVINAKSTLKVKLSDLKLEKNKDEWQYFEINTKKYSKLNKSQRTLAERVHGKGKAFDRTMKMLSDAGKSVTRIYVLNQEYVKKTLTENNAKSLARLGFLNNFGDYSYFNASSRDVVNGGRRLRGVRRDAEGVVAQKIDQYDSALQLLTGNPKETLNRIQKKPEYVAKLSKIVTDYLSTKQ